MNIVIIYINIFLHNILNCEELYPTIKIKTRGVKDPIRCVLPVNDNHWSKCLDRKINGFMLYFCLLKT